MPRSPLFRGDRVGVFAGANGYYLASMASDGVSHYQPASQGAGWSEDLREALNARAAALEHGEEEERACH